MDAGAGPSEPPAELNAARKKTAAPAPRKLVIKAFKGASELACAAHSCSLSTCLLLASPAAGAPPARTLPRTPRCF
jgi:hypothetical protein